MACSWTKQAIYQGGFLNTVNDAVIGGQLTTVPNGVQASQGEQTLPGDHYVLDEAAALGASKTSVGTLHGGYYQYVLLDPSATTLALGQALFWKLVSNTTGIYTVTNVESGNLPLFAGVVINPSWTPGNYSWIQALGRATVLSSGAITAAGGVSLAAAGAGATNATFIPVSATLANFVGVSEAIIGTGTTGIIDIQKVTLRF